MGEENQMVNYELWHWGWLQWGHEWDILTKGAEEELAQAKEDNPDVDFEQLAIDVRSGALIPRR